MKKFVSIFLLFCLIAPITGTYIWLQYDKKITRKEIKRQIISGMDKNELVLLKFTKASASKELRWEHSKEFEYKGQMYDIVETEVKGDTVSYRCWWDNVETKLNIKLSALAMKALGNNEQSRENNKRLQQFFKSLYHSTTPNDYEPSHIVAKILFIDNTLNYISYSKAPIVPPPQGYKRTIEV